MDCICCGFGAVLLLFILTAKAQVTTDAETTEQLEAAAATLQAAIREAEAKDRALDKEIEALDPQPQTNATSLAQLAARQERLAKAIQERQEALAAIETPESPTEAPGFINRPSADNSYLSGLRMRGPKAVIVLERSGSMLAEDASTALQTLQTQSGASAEKWLRAKAAVRAVVAAIPKGTEVAILAMGADTKTLSGAPNNPYIDPYDNGALIAFLEQLDRLEAGGGANLYAALQAVNSLPQRASSLLILADGLPTAPAPAQGSLSESDRIALFSNAQRIPTSYPVNAILFPFEGDPSAAGLFWDVSRRTGGVTLIPDNDWPSL